MWRITSNVEVTWFSILCNVNFAGRELGAESTLPYLSPELNGQRLLVGANFASAGIGILNDTGIQFVSKNLDAANSVIVASIRLYLK